MKPADVQGHEWVGTKRGALPWVVCDRCGLVALRNSVTALAIKLGCGYKDSPRWVAYWRARNAS